jgi:hypothetical protein
VLLLLLLLCLVVLAGCLLVQQQQQQQQRWQCCHSAELIGRLQLLALLLVWHRQLHQQRRA